MRPAPSRILLIRMGAMGDIVHTLPSAAALRRAFPGIEMDWLVEQRWAPLLEGNPHLSAVHPIQVQVRDWRGALAKVRELRARRYDCAVDFQGLLKSALLARLAAPGEVLGFRKEVVREKPACWFYDRRVAPQGVHVVEHNLALARAAGAAEISLPIEFPLPHSAAADESIARVVEPLGEFFAVSPSAGWAAKRWPPESFAQLLLRAEKELDLRAAINCGPGEESLAARVVELARGAGPVVVDGGIPELLALARQARVFVAGDTGPLHLAAAAGTPVVAIFGPTDPARNGPYSPRARVLRASRVPTTYSRSVNGDAIARVTVQEAFQALASLLRG